AQPNGPPFEIVQSEADGSFRVVRLAEGKYTLRAVRQGYAQQALLQHENFWSGVAVGPGKDSLHVRFALDTSATITGQVTDENGESVRGAEVTLWSKELQNGKEEISQEQSSSTNDEGRYRFEHLAAGNYSVSVRARPWYSRYVSPAGIAKNSENLANDAEYKTGKPVVNEGGPAQQGDVRNSLPDAVYPTLYYPAARDWHEMEWLILRPGQVEGADFQLVPEPSVRLRVHADTGTVLMTDVPTGQMQDIRAPALQSEPGVEEYFGIAAGRYEVEPVGTSQENREGQKIDVSGNADLQIALPEAAGIPIVGVLQPIPGGPKIDQWLVEVTDEKGREYKSPLFNLSNSNREQPGSFAIGFLPTGPQTYEFTVLQPIDAMVKNIEVTGGKLKGTRIETEGTEQVNLIVTVEQISVPLAGVALKNGKPFAGAMILLVPENGKDLDRRARRDQSDTDGTFRLQTVLPGKYAVMALEKGWELEWLKPEVLKPLIQKAKKIEIGNTTPGDVTLDVQ
ncbi:MAG TPA: carboxypeptidase-like regulatory domain-containing protein, partial [Candidatus Acidoferrum sp.]|nr:carboxypeptidase-like regulatory domain-containing protein [Candidatus Acidoferrum sp.]